MVVTAQPHRRHFLQFAAGGQNKEQELLTSCVCVCVWCDVGFIYSAVQCGSSRYKKKKRRLSGGGERVIYKMYKHY